MYPHDRSPPRWWRPRPAVRPLRGAPIALFPRPLGREDFGRRERRGRAARRRSSRVACRCPAARLLSARGMGKIDTHGGRAEGARMRTTAVVVAGIVLAGAGTAALSPARSAEDRGENLLRVVLKDRDYRVVD